MTTDTRSKHSATKPAKTLQELRDLCGSDSSRGREIVAMFSHMVVVDNEDGEADLAAMLHFADHHGAASIKFNDKTYFLGWRDNDMSTNKETIERGHEYVIADQGSLVGRVYFLEVGGGEEILLKGDPEQVGSEYKLYGDSSAAEDAARAEIRRRFSDEQANSATFRFVRGSRR